MPINSYIENIAKRYALGNATEHTFRGDLQHLIEELIPEVAATNEPKRIDCGAPDFVLTRKDIPVGYIEAKDVGKDLDAKEFKEQFDRYRDALDNLVITDNLDFRFFVDGEPTAAIRIGEVSGGKVVALQENFAQFTNLIKEFSSRTPQTIKSSKKLAEMMAEKAKILAFIIKNALEEDIAANVESDLTNQLKAFKDILIHDIDPKAFADIYAQTIAYGMFAARLHDPTLPTFSRQEAAGLIPKTNPFLRKLFQFIAAYDLDTRIDWIVDALADLFRATDIAAILKNFGKSTQTHDPIMHFYETFLAEYDPKLRKSRGVFYTPEPVVDFIVRAVDDILKTEFNLPNGLADTSKTKIKVDVQGKLQEREVHKVQILDPATGTGTFLATIIKHIYKGFENQQGVWNQYVDEHLIPRLNGFELLMASYAMAHLKLDLLLTETGYGVSPTASAGGSVSSLHVSKGSTLGGDAARALTHVRATDTSDRTQRFQVYLTNALEEYHPDTGTLFASWLSTEANEANHIKRDTPVMVVMGNPPYSGESKNKGEWIQDQIEEYKKEPSGEKLQEQNSKWINDDYVKFIRYAQFLVDRNGEGILAFITNNGYLDNPTFRGMRFSLCNTFDTIYSIDLHGSAKRQEKDKDGSADKNVFDIQQGVSIILALKTKRKGCLVRSIDWLGSRESKYNRLLNNSISSIAFTEFVPFAPNYYFKNVDEKALNIYNDGFHSLDLFLSNVMGFQTHRDNFAIAFEQDEILKRVSDLKETLLSDQELFQKYDISDNRDWKLNRSRSVLRADQNWKEKLTNCTYRPFDERPCYFSEVTMDYPRKELIQNVLSKENYVFGVGRQGNAVGEIQWCLTTISTKPVDANVFRRGGINLCPLYTYPDTSHQPNLDGRTERIPNLNSEIVDKIADAIGLTFTNEKEETDGTFAPIDILDYIYAVLHSPSYREKYKEFLKIDFPRVPYPKDGLTFWELVALGGELRKIHLLESPTVSKFITGFPVGGDNTVEKIAFVSVPPAVAGGLTNNIDISNGNNFDDPENVAADLQPPATAGGSDLGRVYFNATQYFAGVPEIAWNFYIGGYQPAQKWLKDRKGRKLSFDDINHYQKIIVALTETERIMKEIDEIEIVN